jgi:hypothetical protein
VRLRKTGSVTDDDLFGDDKVDDEVVRVDVDDNVDVGGDAIGVMAEENDCMLTEEGESGGDIWTDAVKSMLGLLEGSKEEKDSKVWCIGVICV